MNKYIYVAGAMSSPSCITFLDNVRKGQRVALKILLMGNHPFCPFLDFQYFLQLRDGEEITLEQIRNYSMAWLRKCDMVFLVPGYEKSEGTMAEIKEAMELGIPIAESWQTMATYWKFP